jgi:hypothetical protein
MPNIPYMITATAVVMFEFRRSARCARICDPFSPIYYCYVTPTAKNPMISTTAPTREQSSYWGLKGIWELFRPYGIDQAHYHYATFREPHYRSKPILQFGN